MAAAAGVFGIVAFRTATTFVVAPPAAATSHLPNRLSPALLSWQAEDVASRSRTNIGLCCMCGLAVLAAATSAKGRQLSAKGRGAVAVHVGAGASQISDRLQQAFKMSADIQKSMAEVEGRNNLVMQKLEKAQAKVKALEAERDGLKAQLLGLVNRVDTALMGPLKTSTSMATQLSALKEHAAGSQGAAAAKVQTLEAERDALKAQLNDLVGQIDMALLGPLAQSAQMLQELSVLKDAAATSSSAPGVPVAVPAAAASSVATSYASPKTIKGKKGKVFFPLPYPDFSIGECYAY